MTFPTAACPIFPKEFDHNNSFSQGRWYQLHRSTNNPESTTLGEVNDDNGIRRVLFLGSPGAMETPPCGHLAPTTARYGTGRVGQPEIFGHWSLTRVALADLPADLFSRTRIHA